MRRGRVFILLALVLLVGVAAVAVLGQRYLNPPAGQAGGDAAPVVVPETVNIIRLVQPVARGAILDESVLEETTWPKDEFKQGMYTSVNEVLGQQAKFDLEAGLPLTSGMLAADPGGLSASGSSAALRIPRGMVAVSIPIDRLSSVSYAPQPGDHVNVIATMTFVDLDADFQSALPNLTGMIIGPGPTEPEGGPSALTAYYNGGASDAMQGKAEVDPVLGQSIYVAPAEPQRPRMAAQNLLQDAVVLHVGDFPLTPQAASPGTSNLEQIVSTEGAEAAPAAEPVADDGTVAQPAPLGPEVITLIVSPQDAVTLNYLILNPGTRLSLALRSAGDDSRVQTEAVTLQFLLDQYRISIPVKLPYGLEPRVGELVPPQVGQPTPTPVP